MAPNPAYLEVNWDKLKAAMIEPESSMPQKKFP
jgi:hypothetical protein